MYMNQVKKYMKRTCKDWKRHKNDAPDVCATLDSIKHKLEFAECFHVGEFKVFNKLTKDLVFTHPDDSEKDLKLPYKYTWIDGMIPTTDKPSQCGILVKDSKEPGYLFDYVVFMKIARWELIEVVFSVSDKGLQLQEMFEDTDMSLEVESTVTYLGSQTAHILSTFLNLLCCRNVVAEPTTRRGRKNKVFGSTHKVLTVKKPGKNTSGSYELTGNTRLHMCRGHFKTFTEDKPLLGKVVGTFWWQPHPRGNRKVGEVTKTYEVQPEG